MTKEGKKSIWNEGSMLVGLVLTIIVIGLFSYFLIFFPVTVGEQHYVSKWRYLLQASPNEIGDTLAGVAGSLAFVWLVVTVRLQATELSEQRKEFEKMADAQEAQVAILQAQGKIFQQEQLERSQEGVRREVEELLLMYKDKFEHLAPKFTLGNGQRSIFDATYVVPDPGGRPSAHVYYSDLGVEDYFTRRAENLLLAHEQITENLEKGNPKYKIEVPKESVRYLISCFSDVREMRPNLSTDQKTRLTRMRLADMEMLFGRILELDIWGDDGE